MEACYSPTYLDILMLLDTCPLHVLLLIRRSLAFIGYLTSAHSIMIYYLIITHTYQLRCRFPSYIADSHYMRSIVNHVSKSCTNTMYPNLIPKPYISKAYISKAYI